eukprot:CAMPEP_0113943888 /NCGR_PEP_ID=MMETSP1339-20121228/29240_1 /TAXON_ID=94617 /ORGANISM="Fibrocapsa japonica" /LENGTH=129 /DNA_ID=CAMNT_0000948873 /DNA_START=190 /DNA_END=579 /DNA_ORIENTATION=+ /assembly_acc=CAM_ASM_000762
MAEAFCRKYGEGKVTFASAGLQKSRVHPKVAPLMQEIGIDVSIQTSNAISEFKPDDFDIVISMCGCGANVPEEWMTGKLFEDWLITDPDGLPDEEWPPIRDQIEGKVKNLVEQMTGESTGEDKPSCILV